MKVKTMEQALNDVIKESVKEIEKEIDREILEKLIDDVKMRNFWEFLSDNRSVAQLG